MSPRALRSIAQAYGVALFTGITTVGIWFVLLRTLEPNPFPFLLAAVVISALYGGFGPGLTTTLLGGVISWVIYVDPRHHAGSIFSGATLRVEVYLAMALGLNWYVAIHRRKQQRYEEQLALSSAISHNLGEGVFALDRAGRVRFLNPAAEHLLGWNAAEIRGKELHAAIHRCSSDAANPCPLLRVPRSSETIRVEDDSFLRKEGDVLGVAYTASPIVDDGQVTGSILAFSDITERKQTVESLRASEERYRSLIDTSPDSIWLTDIFGFVVMANRQAASLFGFGSADEMRGANSVELLAPQERLRAVQDKRKTIEDGSLLNAEYLYQAQDGAVFPVELNASVLKDQEGKPDGIMYMAREISERKKAEETLRASESRLSMQYAATRVLAQSASLNDVISSLLETMCKTAGWDVGIFWKHDRKYDVLQFQALWHQPNVHVSALRRESQHVSIRAGWDLPGMTWAQASPVWIEEVSGSTTNQRALAAVRDGLTTAFCFPILIDGNVHAVIEFYARAQRKESEDLLEAMTTMSALIGQFMERKQAEDALEYQAMHDALTDLPNRVLFHDRVQQAVLSSNRTRRSFALLLMDLDHFKEVNDTFGHHYGDLLLQEVSARLRRVLRGSDTVARLGGDEFAMLLPNVDVIGATSASGKILEELRAQVVLEGKTFDIGASIGIAMYPDHGEDANALLRLADVAMYVAKRGGLGYSIYETNQDHNSPSKMALKSELRNAIENDQLLLHYQPKVDLATGKINSVEALVRWQHPQHGLIQPDQFISLAEQTGLIQVLSQRVLSVALRQCREWNLAGIDMRVAVNLSAFSLHDPQLVDMIAGMLQTAEVEPQRLQVEITESAVMQDPDQALQILTRLHEMGVCVSIDDFGTGHSSLAYLRRLPVDELKIDKSFVMDMPTNADDAFIVRSVIDLAHQLGLHVVAEGVETLETLNILTTLGCDLVQGSYLSEPVGADDVMSQCTGDSQPLLHAG